MISGIAGGEEYNLLKLIEHSPLLISVLQKSEE